MAVAVAATVVVISAAGCAYLFWRGTIAHLAVGSQLGGKDIESQIRRSFRERYADRVATSADLAVDQASEAVRPHFVDGDDHFAGHAPDIDLCGSFHPVPGFGPGKPGRVFQIYENVHCRLCVQPHTISITTEKGLENDVELVMEIDRSSQQVVRGGRFVSASLLDLDGTTLMKHWRTVSARGTLPEAAVKGLRPSDRLHVYGLPRVRFADLVQRVRQSAWHPAVLTANRPYEIVVLGVSSGRGAARGRSPARGCGLVVGWRKRTPTRERGCNGRHRQPASRALYVSQTPSGDALEQGRRTGLLQGG